MRIALALSLHGFSGGILRGVAAFARPNLDWIFEHDEPTPEGIERLLKGQPSGLIICSQENSFDAVLPKGKLPVVNVGTVPIAAECARVLPDDAAIGAMAADYFLSRHYRHFAYFGLARMDFSLGRWKGFSEALGARGIVPLALHLNEEGKPVFHDQHRAHLREWLGALPKPIALFCDSDYLAWAAEEVARLSDMRVPSDIAVLGVDNDPTICELAYPQLSSVQLASERVGFEAARSLLGLMHGEQGPSGSLLVPPLRVVERQSTELMITSDGLVGRALKYMRANLKSSEDVATLCGRLGTSRRNFERRFRSATGQTPAQVWADFRVEEAARLLIETDINLETVASLSGFSDTHQLHTNFKRITSKTPLGFRRMAHPAFK